MQLGKLAKRLIDLPEVSDLEYLRQGTFKELVIVLFALAWFVVIRSTPVQGVLDNLPVALILSLGALSAIGLRRISFRAARYALIVSFIVAIIAEAWLFPGSPARYYFSVAVVISSLLVSHAGIFVIAILTSLIYTAMAWQQGVSWSDSERMLYPQLLIYLTAAATWLGSRQLHLSLAWMQNSYAQALKTMVQLRRQRAILARTAKALEHAYLQIERMNHALIEAHDAAEEARRIKTEFAANISHELRTPLNLIIGFSETMANAPETYGDMVWPPSLRGDVEQIYQSSHHLESLIDDILDLSALDARRLGLVMTEVDIDDVIAEAVSVIEALFQAKGLYLKLDIPPDLPPVRLDPTRIRQVMLNLLNNASRFTTVGGVTITAQKAEQYVRVAVTDTGMGIEPKYIDRVFEEFRQVDGSARRKYGGTGLGIPLSKRLVELHSGRMWLKSVPGVGTTFYFTVPIASQNQSTAQHLERRNGGPLRVSSAHRKTIFVLQPDPLLLHTLHRYLNGYNVLKITKLADLAASVSEYQPVALLIDSQRADEFSMSSARLKTLPPDLPIITFSLRDSITLGARDYLIKPVTRLQLLTAVENLKEAVQEVLIVDDDPRVLELLSRMLQSAGKYQPVTAIGGTEALSYMRRRRPDVILLDLMMPEIDGFGVLEAMRANPKLADIPVIIISAQAYLSDDMSEGSGSLGLLRRDKFSVVESLTCLQSLLDALPLRMPSRPEAVPMYSATLGD